MQALEAAINFLSERDDSLERAKQYQQVIDNFPRLARNMPALLQHLSLSPGTGYAITTLTKYALMLVGGLIGFSIIGVEWSKLQ